MAEQITLNPIADITQSTSAQNTINANNQVIETAFLDVLSLSGTAPNQMQNTFDMNSNQIINLPSPATANSPLRLQDLSTFNGGGTIASLPSGGTTGQVLAKVNATNYNVQWQDQNTDLAAGTNIAITGTTPATISTVTTPTFTSVNKVALTAPATAATLTIANNKTLTANNSLTLAGTDGTTMTFPGTSDTVVTLGATQTLTGKTLTTPIITNSTTPTGAGVLGWSGGFLNWGDSVNNHVAVAADTTQTLTNKTFNTAGTGNVFQINGTTISANTGTGSNVLATSPALVTPTLGAATATTLAFSPTTGGIIGTTAGDNASAGNVGEYIQSVVVSGSAVTLSSTTPINITSISLTAGDWDIDTVADFLLSSSTSVTQMASSISGTTGTLDTTPGKFMQWFMPATIPGANTMTQCIPPYRLNLTSTTTVFFVAQLSFTVSTAAVYGIIRARRIR